MCPVCWRWADEAVPTCISVCSYHHDAVRFPVLVASPHILAHIITTPIVS